MSTPDPARRPRRLAVAAALIGLGLAVMTAGCGAQPGDAVWQAPQEPTTSAATTKSPEADEPDAPDAISLSATGDIVMGNAPGSLPPNNGKGFFDGVKKSLVADLVMGNLEEPLTDDTGRSKCAPKPNPTPGGKPVKSSGCHQFRAPPEYAQHLKDAGFDLLNQANNHGNDYGPEGYKNTQKALEKYDLAHTGAVDQITVVEVEGVKVAVAGFSSYAWNNSLVDIDRAKAVIAKAVKQADIVVVQVHMGGEGSDKTRVKPGTEMFLGENRGDPVKFAHAMIDSGADLIVGHGPHVLRGLEFYKGRLIAYSLGNFAGGGGTLSRTGPLGLGAVLKVELTADGGWAGGEFISTSMNAAGKPVTDTSRKSLAMVTDLSEKDFPKTGAEFDKAGKISPPDA